MNIFKRCQKLTELNIQNQFFFSVKRREVPQFLSLTDRAAERIKNLIQQKQGEEIMGVKIGVKQRGCSGLTYTMNYVKEKQKFDEVIQDKGVKVIVDNKALLALVGTEMDYVEDDLRSEFVFNNPNSKGTCGCGESFYV